MSNSRSNDNQRRPKRRRKGSLKAAKDFYGDPAKVNAEERRVKVSTEPAAVVSSLGRPPLSGQETIAEHYFAAVYSRAVSLAGALAAASDLVETDDDDADDE